MVRWARALVFALAVASGAAAAETPVERGRYLVESILACGNCHSPRGSDGRVLAGKSLAGGITFDLPPFLVTASNITRDRETGIGAWSAADIKRALIEGARPSVARQPGVPLAAIMPVSFYKALIPSDLDAVAAYLRSVPAVRNPLPEPIYRVPAGHQPYPDAEKRYTAAALRDPVTRGRYLATIGHCMECHTPMAGPVVQYDTAFGKGGRDFGTLKGAPPSWQGSIARNITSHRTAGIGAWTDAEIKRAITKGISRDGRPLKPPMAYDAYGRMTAADLSALVAWLRTVPPLD